MRSSDLQEMGLKDEENEVIDALAALPRAVAPANMETRVRSRIKSGNAVSRRPFWLLPASISAAAILLAVVASVYLTIRIGDNGELAVVAPVEPSAHQTASVENIEPPTTIDPQASEALPPTNVNVSENRSSTSRPRSGSTNSDPGGGPPPNRSLVETVRPEPAPLTRDNADDPEPPRNIGEPRPSMLISAQSFLQMIGASVSYSDGGWRVSNVTNTSIADAAGLKNGDVITAIGSRRLGAQTLLDGTQIEQRLEVRRDGKTVVLRLNRR